MVMFQALRGCGLEARHWVCHVLNTLHFPSLCIFIPKCSFTESKSIWGGAPSLQTRSIFQQKML